ncbi:MAG: STAS domain-containing protein [Mycobacterium sp.]
MTITRINPALDCGAAHVRAQCRHLGTVVTISGRVETNNVALVSQRVRRFVLTEKPVIVDLSDVESGGQHVISLLRDLQFECDTKTVDWCIIANDQVAEAIWRCGMQDDVPMARSVPEALKSFGDAVNARRRLLPILTKTA